MKYLNKIAATMYGVAFLIGCQDPEYPAAVPSSTVRSAKVVFINAAPDAPTPQSFLVNNAEGSSTPFPGGSSVLVNASTEQFRIANAIYGVVGSDTVSQKADLVSQTSATAIVGNGNYTLILTDTVKRPFGKGSAFASNKGGLTFVSMITDNLAAPAAGNAGIRFFNLAPGAPAFFLTSNTTTPSAGLPMPATISVSKAYKATSATFTAVPAGNYNLELRTGSATGPVVASASLPNTAIADGKLYTIFASGKAVKIGTSTVVKVPYKINIVGHN